MKAACITEHGPPENLQIRDVPDIDTPADDELLIDITVSAVNPIDTYLRSGSVGGTIDGFWIPGCDFAGRVAAVGANVSQFAPGDRVWGSNQSLSGRQGTLAERIAVSEQWVYPIPDSVTDEAAAAGALTGITAHLGLHLHGNLAPGEVVFVHGGTGGVGSAVIQLARLHNARVITTVGTAEKAAIAADLGADCVIRYDCENVSERVREAAAEHGGVSLWYETLRTPSPETTIPLLARRGRMIIMAGRDARPILPAGPLYVNDLRIIGFAMFNASADEQRVCAECLNRAAAEGRFRPVIGHLFSLEQAAAAHRLQEDNTIHGAGTLCGKIVVTVSD